MPDQDSPLHRVRGLVSGANWRATKFVTPVPPRLFCGLCRVISPTTVLLPCFHTLCESCLSHSASDGNAACPFDEMTFSVGECKKFQLPPASTENLKACCWNYSQGCTFVGTLQAVLTHYERECTFHVVSCPRCNGPVLQQDLPRHYRARCYCENTAPGAVQPTVHPDLVLSPDDIGTRLHELKALISDLYQDRLSALQRKINHLLEGAGNIGAQVEAIARALSNSKNQLTQASGHLSTPFGQESPPQRSGVSTPVTNISDVGTSGAREAETISATEMPWKSEKRHILRKLELVAADSLAYLELLRQRADEQVTQPVAEFKPLFSLPFGDVKVDMTPFMGKVESDEEGYVVVFQTLTTGLILGSSSACLSDGTVALSICKWPFGSTGLDREDFVWKSI